jgi:hypothetical protein
MTFRLPAGTILKHGTRSGALRSILSDGMRPQGRQSSPRSTIEPTPLQSDGCYVGWFLAYFGAYASWAEYVHQMTMSALRSRRIPAWFRFECPVIVEFELREPVEVRADEDFVPLTPEIEADLPLLARTLSDDAQRVWELHRSCVVRGLPAAWVRGFEFLDMTCADVPGLNPSPLAVEQLRADLHTLAIGVAHQQHHLAHDDAMALWREYVAFDPAPMPTLSRRVPVETAQDFLARYPLFNDKHRTLAGYASLWTYEEIAKLSPKFGIASTS